MHTLENKNQKGGINVADNKVIENPYKGLEIVDGHAVKAPEDYQDPKMLYEALIKRIRKYHPSTDISMVEKAFNIAYHAHEGQFRKSGDCFSCCDTNSHSCSNTC